MDRLNDLVGHARTEIGLQQGVLEAFPVLGLDLTRPLKEVLERLG
ncbi:unannotated protein [freshwater metagenome]|uniref:Unannotated protein n=1 Tax=freshwater metagenome TaxID=449393 RepID=A0A6J7DH33_9ZZZZ